MIDIQVSILYVNTILLLGVILFGFVVAIFYYLNGNKILSVLSGLITAVIIYFTVKYLIVIFTI